MHRTVSRRLPTCPGYVVFGLDEHDRPHAAWFSAHEHHVARIASNMAGFRLLEPHPTLPRRLADWLPCGTRLESGRFVIPRVRQGLYEKLCVLEEQAEHARECASLTCAIVAPGSDTDSDELARALDAALDWDSDEAEPE